MKYTNLRFVRLSGIETAKWLTCWAQDTWLFLHRFSHGVGLNWSHDCGVRWRWSDRYRHRSRDLWFVNQAGLYGSNSVDKNKEVSDLRWTRKQEWTERFNRNENVTNKSTSWLNLSISLMSDWNDAENSLVCHFYRIDFCKLWAFTTKESCQFYVITMTTHVRS